MIEKLNWDFGDGTKQEDTKISATHSYLNAGKKIASQKILLKNGNELVITSTLNIRDPEQLGNQAINIQTKGNNTKDKDLELSFQSLWIGEGHLWAIRTFLNTKEIHQARNPKEGKTFFTITNRQGLLKIKNEIQIGENLRLYNEGIAFLGNQAQAGKAIELDPDKVFSGLKCDFDHDGIPDLYDDDIDGDGVKNLLGMISFEREDCAFIVGENIDKQRYEEHFWVCDLDNCPLAPNQKQSDLNANGIGDQCEIKEPLCGNGRIEKWENCKNCPIDVGPCTAFCRNGQIEKAENCSNCHEDVPLCLTSCGDGKLDPGEECDEGSNNRKNKSCSVDCKRMDPKKPLCGNGEIDYKEDCKNCPEDLKDICIDDGFKPEPECWNGQIDPGENCTNCPQDVPNCDQDGDGCPDPVDPCPQIPGINNCCPDLPDICKEKDCPLVTPICNQCPCHYADFSNTLQRNDTVRARLRDNSFKVHYDYSNFVPLKKFLETKELL